ncbi:MAG: 16S rRNA (guanine(966)-N(2))-methyltransferase RsmD [Clostridiaceae bacterium]|nr:16S rRNA (guanine(966)-N(2))-methyltransferase RsmD [Clostridiaceae bacterium]
MLRVISGEAKGHKLKTLKSNLTRPTSDKVKGSIFNIIASIVFDSDVLDLFAGTGNLGIEALSRGARSAVFVDKNRECSQIINENLTHTKLAHKAEVLVMDVCNALSKLSQKGNQFDIVFLDPPYAKGLVDDTLACIASVDVIKPDTLIVAEHDAEDVVSEYIGTFKNFRQQKYGDTIISFYRQEV